MAVKDLYLELTDYVKRPYRLVRERCQTAFVELAWKWEEQKNDPIKYYQQDDLYIFDLTKYQMLLLEAGFHDWMIGKINQLGIKKVLDFGGGIGEYTIQAMQNGCDATFIDVEGSKTVEYAQYRFAKYGIAPRILPHTATDFDNYDLVVAMDVFEHIPEPDSLIRTIAEHTQYLICQPNVPYDEFYPQHISRVVLDPYFEHVEHDLWKSKLWHNS